MVQIVRTRRHSHVGCPLTLSPESAGTDLLRLTRGQMEFSIRRPAPLAGASRFMVLCALAAAALAGCGGGGGAGTNAKTTSGAVPPQITAQPQSATVASGATATFSISATGSAPLTYQWMKNSANISG